VFKTFHVTPIYLSGIRIAIFVEERKLNVMLKAQAAYVPIVKHTTASATSMIGTNDCSSVYISFIVYILNNDQHLYSAKKRGPPKGYIETLENRLKRMERILGSLADTADGSKGNASSDQNDSEPDKSSRGSSEDRQPEVMAAATAPSQEPSRKSSETKTTPNTTNFAQPNEERRESKDFIPYAEYERAKYVGDISALHMLTKKYNMEDKALSHDLGAKIHRFGEDIVLVNDSIGGEKGFDLTTLIKYGNVQPEEKIDTVVDWIRIVAGIDMAMSDRLMKV
jgi:hypothetical protein